MERLQEALAALLRANPPPPFEPETMVVSSRGMERWLSLALSETFGVWANARFPFPRAFIESVLDAVLEDGEGAGAAFERQSLRWAVLVELETLVSHPDAGSVRDYLVDDASGDKRIELSERIANAFDQYVVYRPELVLAWEAGEGTGFQAELWRLLVARLGSGHLAQRARRFRQAFARLGELPSAIPRRVTVFGVSALPPIYVEILALLSERVDVHAYLLCPSDARWRRLAAERPSLRREAEAGGPARALAHTPAVAEPEGLLFTLGGVERELQQVLETLVEYRDVPEGFFEPTPAGALFSLQADVYAARASGAGPLRAFDDSDASLSIHCCHGPMRELEVLRDQLLAAFQADATLAPHDVLVMTPDIEAYAPFVHAVFGVERDALGFIPYRIADRSRRAESPVAEALLAALAVLSGRMGASDVLDLLRHEPVRARFGFDADDLSRLMAWVEQTNIRSFLDAEHRREHGLPAVAENSWRFGLERLLLGFALPGNDRELFRGTLPFDAVEGQSALLAGRLAELLEHLAALRSRWRGPRTLREWRGVLAEIENQLLAVAERDSWQLRALHETLDTLISGAERVGFDSTLDASVMQRLLSHQLESDRVSDEFLSGGATFAALLPMRSIPFRVVCLVGMNDGDFPRTVEPPAFDEIAKTRRIGDRSRRDEDRHLFLEALLSARERLVVTYVGRGIQDDGVRPPSVVVSELIDAVDATFASRSELSAPGTQLGLFERPNAPSLGSPPSGTLSVVHPLQPWSERYFGADANPRLFSHGRVELDAARALRARSLTERVFFACPLPAQGGEPTLDDLCDFFGNPTRFLLERRLSLWLFERARVLDEREPMELDALERHRLGSFVFDRLLDARSEREAFELARAAGVLPHGEPGFASFDDVLRDARALAAATKSWRRGERLPPLPFELELDSGRVRGVLRELWPDAQLRHTFSRVKGKTELALWIRHLCLQLVAPDRHPRQSVLVARSRGRAGIEVQRFPPLEREQARQVLSRLVELWRLGLTQPLPFFPESALTYMETLKEQGDRDDAREKALAAARSRFENEHAFGESQDPYICRVFAGLSPICDSGSPFGWSGAPNFAELARTIMGPAAAALETEVRA
jgi:exodeoxyribonuclease V gamma subunit